MTRVTALLVSHDGARWLPAVLDGLAAQTCPVDQVVAVDTSSSDGSADVLRDRLGPESVLTGRPRASYGASVRQGLATLPPTPAGSSAGSPADEWVWLLHDDSSPASDALERLLAAAENDHGVAVLGPKLREWPSLRRLLELGVTISGTGRRETGLERGEYDQGQHDRKREVLAVNTAGMLVRRTVLEEIGLDERLPVFGNDIDFGWRAARAGHRTLVVPDAVVFHVEAAHRGVRRTPLTGQHFHRAERSAALYTLLVNGSAVGLPWRLLRLFLGSLVRVLGFLLVRSPGEAYGEVGALASTYLRPDRIVAGRLARRRTSKVGHREVRPLLAPVWVPYRHGLDFVSDVASAVVNQATDLTAARRDRAAAETGPVDEATENLGADSGVLARLLVSPIAWVFAMLFLVALLGARGHLGAGGLSGGALLPAPDGAGHWWSTAFSGWHDISVGSSAPGAPYLLPLAFAGTVLLGKAWLVVDIAFFLAVPLAAWGAFRFLRRLTDAWPPALWGGVAYGLVPVLSGSVQQGRVGSVTATVVLPWLAHAALFLVIGETTDRRWRAAFRTGLWLALLAAFAPITLVLVAVAAAAGLTFVLVTSRRTFSELAPPIVVALLIAVGLLVPWALFTWTHQGAASFVLEGGLPAPGLVGDVGPLEVVLGRPGPFGAPGWLSAGIAVAAVFALARTDTRPKALVAWSFVLLGLATTAVLAGVRVNLASSADPVRVWLGVPLLVVQGAAITAAALAGTGVRARLSGTSFGWRQPVGLAVTVAALVTPVVGLGWWAFQGTDGPLDRRPVSAVPVYMTDAARSDPAKGVLVVRGDQAEGFRYQLLHDRGLRLGDDSVLPSVRDQRSLTGLVGALASAPEPDDVDGLLGEGVQFVYAPRPVDQQLAGNLDSLSAVAPASSLARGSRAWKLDGQPTAPEPQPNRLQPVLVALECVAVVVAGVFAAPGHRRRAS